MSDLEKWAEELYAACHGSRPVHTLPEGAYEDFRTMAAVVARAVASEREACAAIGDDLLAGEGNCDPVEVVQQYQRYIRARG